MWDHVRAARRADGSGDVGGKRVPERREFGQHVRMLANRSMPRCSVIPELGYEDVSQAIEWLCQTFEFTERWHAGNHRAQLAVGDCAIVVTEQRYVPGRHAV